MKREIAPESVLDAIEKSEKEAAELYDTGA
jgi:hypothetical protein